MADILFSFFALNKLSKAEPLLLAIFRQSGAVAQDLLPQPYALVREWAFRR